MATVLRINSVEYPMLNMTPHDIRWLNDDHTLIMTIPSNGTIRLTRAEQYTQRVVVVQHPDQDCPQQVGPVTADWPHYAPFNGVSVEGIGLDQLDHAALIVSMPVADHLFRFNEFLSCPILIPDTGPDSAVRDARGAIVGVKRMIVYR